MSTPTKRPGRPRQAIITPAVIQRAQELLKEHRAAEQDLAAFTQASTGMARVAVTVHGQSFSVLAPDFARLLAKDVTALEAEARRLGVQLKVWPEAAAPLPLVPAVPQPPLAPPPGPALGSAHPTEEAA